MVLKASIAKPGGIVQLYCNAGFVKDDTNMSGGNTGGVCVPKF